MKKLSHSMEDYIEAMYVVSLSNKVIRVKEVAEYLNVKTPSVVDAVRKLIAKGLVEHEKYGYLELTDKGCRMAREVYEKHKKIYKFFNDVLGVSDEVSKLDACNIEHYISEETLARMIKFINFIDTCPEGYPRWLKNYNYFAKYGRHPAGYAENGDRK